MSSLPYTATFAVHPDAASASAIRALSTEARAALTAALESMLFAPLGAAPQGPPWSGDIEVVQVGAGTALDVVQIERKMIDLVQAWNASYNLEVAVSHGQGGDPTFEWRWINGVLTRVPNDELRDADGRAIDPFRLVGALGEGLSGRLRIEIQVSGR